MTSNTISRILLGMSLLCHAGAGAADEGVAVLLSKESALYREAAAFSESFPGGPAKVYVLPPHSEGAAEVLRRIRRESPAVIVAVGPRAAAESLKAFPKTPLVYLLVIYPDRLGLTARGDVYGVPWLPSPGSLAQTMQLLLPSVKRVGVISSADARTRRPPLGEELQARGVELVVSPIRDASEVPQALRRLDQKIDALWMGLDSALADEATYEIVRTYALQRRLPFLVPFELRGDGKAMAGLCVDPKTAGATASRLARMLSEGKSPAGAVMFPESVHLTIDMAVADSVGVHIPPGAVKAAAKVYGR